MVHEDRLREQAVDAVHGAVEHGEVLKVHQRLDGREAEDALEHVHVVLGGGDDLDRDLSAAVLGLDGSGSAVSWSVLSGMF